MIDTPYWQRRDTFYYHIILQFLRYFLVHATANQMDRDGRKKRGDAPRGGCRLVNSGAVRDAPLKTTRAASGCEYFSLFVRCFCDGDAESPVGMNSSGTTLCCFGLVVTVLDVCYGASACVCFRIVLCVFDSLIVK